MKSFFNWLNTFKNKTSAAVSVVLLICWLLFTIGFISSGSTWSDWNQQAGLGGMIFFYACIVTTLSLVISWLAGGRSK